jgi:hypothetical protein
LSKVHIRILVAGASILTLLLGNSLPSHAQEVSHTFPETGKTVAGRFLQYWTEHGGLAQEGYPISDVIGEVSDTDGRAYTVQYFERAVFEYHPENPPPNDVLLSLLGAFTYKVNYPDGASGEVPDTDVGSRLFAETGKRVGGLFLQYWNSHGGLAQQGYPITDEFAETSRLDGKPYQVQYFERAVFELHPENPAPNDVLLSQLGTFRYQEKYGASSPRLSPPVPVPSAIPVPTATPSAPAKPTAAPKDVRAFASYIAQKYGKIGAYRLHIEHISAHDSSTLGHSVTFYLSQSIPLVNGPSKADGDNWAQAVYTEALSNWPGDKFYISVWREVYDWYPAFSVEGACYAIYDLDPNKGWDTLEIFITMYRQDIGTNIQNCLFDL